MKLNDANKDVLVELYKATTRTVDDLPYTEEFESLYTGFIARTGLTMNPHDVWKALAGCRKGSRLIRKKR